MDRTILIGAIAVLVLAIAIAAATARFGGPAENVDPARNVPTERRADSLAAELERCRTLDLEAADDADCAAAWAENRERFFSTEGLAHDDLQPKRQDRLQPTNLPELSAPSALDEGAR